MRLGNPPDTSLSCEFHFAEELYKGPVLEVYPDGFFVETAAQVEQSSVLEVRLANSATGRAVAVESVVERRFEPTVLAPNQIRGLHLRIFHLTPEYNAIISGMPASGPNAPQPSSARLENKNAERDWSAALAPADAPAAETSSRSRRSDAVEEVAEAERLPEEPWLERAGEPVFEERTFAPRAVVIDDGELSDIVEMLRGFGSAPRRSTPTVEGTLPDWIAPTHLLVISAKHALSLGDSLDLTNAGFTAVVVTDSDSRALRRIVQRHGYHLVVRRPVHLEALRTLLRQALHDGGGRRASPRVATGCRARWKVVGALRRHEGTLVDISPDGCRLLVRSTVPMGTRVQIRIPAAVTGKRRIDVHGRVVRKSRSPGGQTALGILFQSSNQRTQQRLDEIIETLASGPARFDGKPVGDGSVAQSGVTTDAQPDAADAAPPHHERRRKKRAAFQQAVVALDAESEQARLSLIGRDLSLEGIRVEPNPDLALDDHLRLAFYDCSDGEPLILHAVVTRIDGRFGTCLRFIGLDSALRWRLAQAIDSLPSIEWVDTPEPEGAWTALGQVELVPKEGD